jgi:hypothetical protein
MSRPLPLPGPVVAGVSERGFNARVLLEHAAGEIRADLRPDPYEVGLAVSAMADVLGVLSKVSRTLGVEPPEVADLRPWALTLIERATRPAARRRWRS